MLKRFHDAVRNVKKLLAKESKMLLGIIKKNC